MKIVLDDTLIKASLYPFGLIKPVSFIRIGILSIKEKWEIITKAEVFDDIESFLAQAQDQNEKPDFVFPSNILPTKLYWQKAMLDKDLMVSEAILKPYSIPGKYLNLMIGHSGRILMY